MITEKVLFIGGPFDGDWMLIPIHQNTMEMREFPKPTIAKLLEFEKTGEETYFFANVVRYNREKMRTGKEIFSFFIHENETIETALEKLLNNYTPKIIK
jgi:hypothetical protein